MEQAILLSDPPGWVQLMQAPNSLAHRDSPPSPAQHRSALLSAGAGRERKLRHRKDPAQTCSSNSQVPKVKLQLLVGGNCVEGGGRGVQMVCVRTAAEALEALNFFPLLGDGQRFPWGRCHGEGGRGELILGFFPCP